MQKLKLVTIVAEAVLEERILRELRQLGARGYTVVMARGEGTRGIHASSWEGPNLRIETLVSPEVAERIMSHVAAHYFTDYAVIVYSVDAEVVRGEKYL
ncbi:MAG: transcriptional regulator [Chloroflexaceae bacterium]